MTQTGFAIMLRRERHERRPGREDASAL